jgi:hypothetical protein
LTLWLLHIAEVAVFQIKCPVGHILEIDATHIGQRLMCPMCQAVVHVAPAKPGEVPAAKYEVQCSHGHILRVKQKYLGKEVRCPSCQQLVSMKPHKVLTSDGSTLGQAKPELFKKKAPPAAVPVPKKLLSPPPPVQQPKAGIPTAKNTRLTPSMASERIPPPPAIMTGESTNDPPLMAELVQEPIFELDALPIAQPIAQSPLTIPDDDFEFEIVDTQFHMELEKEGVEAPRAAPVVKKSRSGRLTGDGSGRIAPPPSKLEPKDDMLPPPAELVEEDEEPTPLVPPPVQRRPAVPGPPAPTGLHNLSGTEMLQVHKATLQEEELGTVQFNCPNGHTLEVEARFRGAHIQCPVCKIVFQLPEA